MHMYIDIHIYIYYTYNYIHIHIKLHNLESDSRYSGSSLKNNLPLPLGLHANWVATTLPTALVDLHLSTYREIYK